MIEDHQHVYDISRYDANEEGWWWLSFADPRLPKGHQFLGVAIVSATSVHEAVLASRRLKVNPGGQIQMFRIVGPRGWSVLPEWTNRLLEKSEAEAIGVSAASNP